VTPDLRALITTTFAPVIGWKIITGVTDLSFTTFAPTVSATAHVVSTPDPVTLSLTTFAPTIVTPALCTPDTLALVLTAFAPSAGAPVKTTPDTASLTISAFAPTVTNTDNITVTPDLAALALTMLA